MFCSCVDCRVETRSRDCLYADVVGSSGDLSCPLNMGFVRAWKIIVGAIANIYDNVVDKLFSVPVTFLMFPLVSCNFE